MTATFNVTQPSLLITSGITVNTTYVFSIAAQNIYGVGPNSTNSSIVAQSIPPKLNPVVVSQSSTNIVFTWTAPASDNGSPITAYKLSVFNDTTGTY